MGLLIEKYIGKFGRKLFLVFSWLFCGLVIAAFADMVAGTFNAYAAEGALAAAAKTNGAAGSISLFFIAFAILFGLVQRRFQFKGRGPCGRGAGVHRRLARARHVYAADPWQGSLALHHLHLHLLHRRAAHVAAQTARATP